MSRGALFATVSAVALTGGAAGWWARGRAMSARSPAAPVDSASRSPVFDTHEVTRNFLLYVVVPIWLAAGVADWFCHRAANIEGTTGAKESLMHLLLLAETTVPVLAGLFLEITSPVLALMIAAFFLHEATALWDVSYAVTRREVTPIEQHVHSFLEMVPLMALSFVAVLHWPQAPALFGLGPERADLSIRRKKRPLPTAFIAVDLSANLLLEVVPYLEELWRALRASGGRLVPPPAKA